MTEDKDRISCEAIEGINPPNDEWLRINISWPEIGQYAVDPPYPPKTGWVKKVASWQEIYKAILEKIKQIIKMPRTPKNDTNYDSIEVGVADALAIDFLNDWALDKANEVKANNILEIKKNQNSGICECCIECNDCCAKNNIEKIKVGDRKAFAYGSANSENNGKIIANQQ